MSRRSMSVTGLVGESGKELLLKSCSKSFFVTADERDVEGVKATSELRKKNPNVLFVIARSCNINLVVYEAQIDPKNKRKLKEDEPVDIYWLNLEPKYTKEARRRGIPHDRDELAWPERKLAYGARPRPSKSNPGTFHLQMNALPSLPIYIGIDPKTHLPRAAIELHPDGKHPPGTKGGIWCFLERIYVHVVFKLGALPDVDWLTYHATTHDHKPISQKVTRSI